MEKFSEQDVIKLVTEKIVDDNNSIQEQLHDHVWDSIDKILPDKKWSGDETQNVDKALLSISQGITIQSVMVTLNVLTQLGVIRHQSDPKG